MPILDHLVLDIVLAAFLGAIGGLVPGLVLEKGLEMPHKSKIEKVTYADPGFLGDVALGALAAILMYALSAPTQLFPQFFLITFTAGIGGGSILKAYVKGTAAREWANRSEGYRELAEMMRQPLTEAAELDSELVARLDVLGKKSEKTRMRWGPR